MRIDILAVGRLKAGAAERDLVARYRERCAAAGKSLGLTGFAVAEIPDGRDADAEAAQLLAKTSPGARRVVLDEGGEPLTSRQFADRLGTWRDTGTPCTALLIGGADGHGAAARDGADLILSFGRMTWPHQLVRAMLLEQLYRAVTILAGHPYHRD